MNSEELAHKEGMPFRYDQIIDRGEYVTGIAIINSTNGTGRFRLEVSGPAEAVLAYAEEARILQLEMKPFDSEAAEQLERVHQEREKNHREQWYAWIENTCQELHASVESSSDHDIEANLLELIVNLGDMAQRKLGANLESAEIDLTSDRLITLEPIEFEKDGAEYYHLRFVIDPSVAQGQSDYYAPAAGLQADNKSATLFWGGGDPDLYLYRGGNSKARSLKPAGHNEYVGAVNGSGSWSLRVYGYTAAQYTLSTDWILG